MDWISVKDKIPNNREPVFVWNEEEKRVEVCIPYIKYHLDSIEIAWCNVYGTGLLDVYKWMKITYPELPKD